MSTLPGAFRGVIAEYLVDKGPAFLFARVSVFLSELGIVLTDL